MSRTLTLAELRERIEQLPRVKLGVLPTPLHEVPRFSKAIDGPRIFIKRDDLTGLAFGGNKVRMFEFLLAHAIKTGADTIVGGAGVQSNYSRQLVAACNVLGLETHLVLRRVRGDEDNKIQGNLLLDLLAGATVHVLDASLDEQRQAMYDLAESLRDQGKRPFVVRMANDEDLTPDVVSYVDCFVEIVEQCNDLGVAPQYLFVSSYDSTQAGLEIGNLALGSDMQIIGIAPANWLPGAQEAVAKYANQAAARLGVEGRVNAKDVVNLDDYVGERYGVPTPDGIEMIKLMARTEGIFLDPVYTGKAMAGLRDYVRKGRIASRDTVIFLHTGGHPALFAYADELEKDELARHIEFSDRPAP